MTIVKKERKGKERKGKGLLYLIAIAVLIAIVSIACSDKPTAVSDFAEIDDSLVVKTNTPGVASITISTDTSIDSPVVVANGDNIILVYGKNNQIYYRSSSDGGKNLTKEQEFGGNSTGKKYPHIFFDGSTVNAAATQIWKGAYGKVEESSQPLGFIRGGYKMGGNGVFTIIFESSWINLNISLPGQSSGNAGHALHSKLGNTSVQTAAGAGRFIGGKLMLPLTETGESKNRYLTLNDTKISGVNYNSGSANTWSIDGDIKNMTASTIVKFDESGNKFESSEASEKAGSYSITANGKISGITSSPTVGEGTSEASIATSDGYIYTLTKETGGLVFRKFSTSISGSATIK